MSTSILLLPKTFNKYEPIVKFTSTIICAVLKFFKYLGLRYLDDSFVVIVSIIDNLRKILK